MTERMVQLQESIKKEILSELDLSKEMKDEEIWLMALQKVTRQTRECGLSLHEREECTRGIFNSLRKLDMLQELVDDDEITEIMVNGTDSIFYEKGGELHQWEKHFESKDKLLDVIQQIAGSSNRIVNESEPILDTRLKDGSRVNIVLEPASVDGPVISIRKFPKEPITMEQLLRFQTLSPHVAEYLEILVKAGYNIFISGGTGSGKTTFLNALSAFIPEDERVITIEDSAELQIHGIANLVRLETRESRMEGVKQINIRDLVKTSLRMRPDRIIVGEVRAGECLDLLQANNSGHRGSMSSGHGNSAQDMLKRIETMVLMGMDLPISAIRGQIASGIDILIHVGRLRDRSRKVLEITEIDKIEEGVIQLNSIFQFQEDAQKEGKVQGHWKKTGKLKHREKLEQSGYHLPEMKKEEGIATTTILLR